MKRKIVKNGKTKSGVQRFLNQETGETFIKDEDKTSISQEIKELAIKMVVEEGIPFRKTARIFEVSHSTVMNWVYKASQCVNFENLTKLTEVKSVQIDEIYTIVKKKSLDQNTSMYM